MRMRSRVGVAQPLEALDRGGLASAVGPEDPEDLASPNLEGDAVDRARGPVGLAQLVDDDDLLHGPHATPDARGRARVERPLREVPEGHAPRAGEPG